VLVLTRLYNSFALVSVTPKSYCAARNGATAVCYAIFDGISNGQSARFHPTPATANMYLYTVDQSTGLLSVAEGSQKVQVAANDGSGDMYGYAAGTKLQSYQAPGQLRKRSLFVVVEYLKLIRFVSRRTHLSRALEKWDLESDSEKGRDRRECRFERTFDVCKDSCSSRSQSCTERLDSIHCTPRHTVRSKPERGIEGLSRDHFVRESQCTRVD
jgi:hypothetical protein